MRIMTAAIIVPVLASLAACGLQRAAPLVSTVCELPLHPQRLVQISAEVRLRSDGQAVISDASCAAERIELRLTGAAAHAGLERALKTALAAGADNVRVPVYLTGVYAALREAYFTAESLTIAPAAK
jgi:hypothetical protein